MIKKNCGKISKDLRKRVMKASSVADKRSAHAFKPLGLKKKKVF